MKKVLLYSLICVAMTTSIFAQNGVAINTDNSNPHNSAILDVKATDKGLLIPRMTSAQKTAIASPATGLLIFQTNSGGGFYFYNGTAWEFLGGSIETASNGLTKVGNDIQLGGPLGQGTTITHGGNHMTHDLTGNGDLKIADNGVDFFIFQNTGRIVYKDGNQANGKVLTSDLNGVATWQTPTSTGTVETASNGLNKIGDDIQLGGSLTTNSTITHGARNLTFNLSGTGDLHVADDGPPFFTFRDDSKIIYTDGNQALGKVLTSDANGVATWQTPMAAPSIETASNGLTKVGYDTRLGGALTANSTITHGASMLNFNLTTSGNLTVQDNGSTFFLFRNDGKIGYLDGNHGAGKILTSDANGVATWQPSAASGSTETASNGLNKVGSDIRLGGLLTSATTITQGPNNLTFDLTGTGNFKVLDSGNPNPILNVNRDGSITHNNLGSAHSVIDLKSTGNFQILDNGNVNPILNVLNDGSLVHNNLGSAHSIIDLKSTGNFKILDDGNNSPILNVNSDGLITHNNLSTSNSSINLKSTGNFVIEDNGSTFATFTNVGNVNFGGPSYSNVKFAVEYDITGSGRVATFINGADATNAHGININAGSTTTGGASLITFSRGGTNTPIGKVDQNNPATVNYSTTSDKRLKENIHPTPFGLANLLQIGIYDYNYTTDPSKQTCTGYLAQDLYEIYPEAVSKPQDENASPEENPWMVDYGKITPLIIKSVQEQQAQIDALQQENAQLKDQLSEVAQLKADMAEMKALLQAKTSK